MWVERNRHRCGQLQLGTRAAVATDMQHAEAAAVVVEAVDAIGCPHPTLCVAGGTCTGDDIRLPCRLGDVPGKAPPRGTVHVARGGVQYPLIRTCLQVDQVAVVKRGALFEGDTALMVEQTVAVAVPGAQADGGKAARWSGSSACCGRYLGPADGSIPPQRSASSSGQAGEKGGTGTALQFFPRMRRCSP